MDLDKTRQAWLRYINPPSHRAVAERSDDDLFRAPVDEVFAVAVLILSHGRISRHKLTGAFPEISRKRLGEIIQSLLEEKRIRVTYDQKAGICYGSKRPNRVWSEGNMGLRLADFKWPPRPYCCSSSL
jgi:hypothetical protein